MWHGESAVVSSSVVEGAADHENYHELLVSRAMSFFGGAATEEAKLFEALFSGDDSAKEYCKAVDEVGASVTTPPSVGSVLDSRPAITAAAGIAAREGRYTIDDEAKLASYNTRKNAARVAWHMANQAKLEAQLDAALYGGTQDATTAGTSGKPARAATSPMTRPTAGATSAVSAPCDSGGARAAVTRMASEHGLVASALLQGLRAALLRQASEGSFGHVQWTLSKAHLINGGAAYVDDSVGLLRACGFDLVTRRKPFATARAQTASCGTLARSTQHTWPPPRGCLSRSLRCVTLVCMRSRRARGRRERVRLLGAAHA